MEKALGLEMLEVCKRYGGRAVLDGVSLAVRAGDCACVIGDNGCGKSTLLRIAAGLTRPDAGSVRREANCSLQYVPDQFPPIALTGRQFLRRMAQVDLSPDDALVRRFHLEAQLDQSIAAYSKGTRGKIGALQALLARPGLLLLDEPVSGQDESARAVFVSTVQDLMAKGCAVVMACHERELIDALATRVLRLENGKLLPETGSPKREPGCLCARCRLLSDGSCAGGRNYRA